jgi:hypothetical protein
MRPSDVSAPDTKLPRARAVAHAAAIIDILERAAGHGSDANLHYPLPVLERRLRALGRHRRRR